MAKASLLLRVHRRSTPAAGVGLQKPRLGKRLSRRTSTSVANGVVPQRCEERIRVGSIDFRARTRDVAAPRSSEDRARLCSTSCSGRGRRPKLSGQWFRREASQSRFAAQETDFINDHEIANWFIDPMEWQASNQQKNRPAPSSEVDGFRAKVNSARRRGVKDANPCRSRQRPCISAHPHPGALDAKPGNTMKALVTASVRPGKKSMLRCRAPAMVGGSPGLRCWSIWI